MKPRVFIGSSTEHHNIAVAVQMNLAKTTTATAWDQGVGSPSDVFIDALIRQLADSDFAVLVFAADDLVTLRDQEFRMTRDNVVFELGLAMGILGRDRTAVILPENMTKFRVPTDLNGIVAAFYDAERPDKNWQAATIAAVKRIEETISRLKPRQGCAYLQRYAERDEPSILAPNASVTVSFQRLYQILLYMLQQEKVHDFRAFDLAFERWRELLRPDETQTFNVSNEIFAAVGRMLRDNRCRTFRRLLVASPDQLRTRAAARVLRRFNDQENAWRARSPEIFIETRIYGYPDRSQVATRNEISKLHDFALFAGDDGTFGLVETKSSPLDDKDTFTECRVVTDQSSLEHMTKSFDDFWDDAEPIPAILERLSDCDAKDDARRPGFKAYEYFLDHYASIEPHTALVIEAGYFDLRNLNDADRRVHLDDAFFLLESVQSSCENVRGSIFLEAFINDLGVKSVCQIDACKPPLQLEDDRQRTSAVDELWTSLRAQYRLHDLRPDEFRLYGMKRTRNEVAKVIKEALKRGNPRLREEQTGERSVQIYVDPLNGPPILLGLRDAASMGITTARCSALLAQHYFDLYAFVKGKRPDLSELWIFDFNRLTEQESVRMGAEASFILHPWPPGFKLHIVNCIYGADGRTGGIQVI